MPCRSPRFPASPPWPEPPSWPPCPRSRAQAHPHVWVTTKAEIAYGEGGRVTGIRHAWTFDASYSAFVTQGLDANGDGKLTPDELAGLAAENTANLAEFGYFTKLKVGRQGAGLRRAGGAPYGDGGRQADLELPAALEGSGRAGPRRRGLGGLRPDLLRRLQPRGGRRRRPPRRMPRPDAPPR